MDNMKVCFYCGNEIMPGEKFLKMERSDGSDTGQLIHVDCNEEYLKPYVP